MKPQLIAAAELDRLETWQKYSAHMCGGCVSSCCTLPVEVKVKDLIRIGLVDEFELGDPAKNIAFAFSYVPSSINIYPLTL